MYERQATSRVNLRSSKVEEESYVRFHLKIMVDLIYTDFIIIDTCLACSGGICNIDWYKC